MAQFTNIVLVFTIIIAVCGAEPMLRSDIHNYFNCPQPEKAKSVIFDEPINVPPRWFTTRSKTVVFPQNTINTVRIACILLKDLDVDDNGGYPSVIDGGVGNYEAIMQFQSQRGKGINFRIRIYGEE